MDHVCTEYLPPLAEVEVLPAFSPFHSVEPPELELDGFRLRERRDEGLRLAGGTGSEALQGEDDEVFKGQGIVALLGQTGENVAWEEKVVLHEEGDEALGGRETAGETVFEK
ncbi:uncharacterized protein LOC62_07G008899 [Vanrija pseudolonga]|uniref:Uncharacterized protein n=1 Tax=Vanrija pseudolonga TaxID=143232 RepID=A0AAF0YHR4_9TREE|nr:hypothetical protein LOC62_07G008899 [Vanrija pseudolonga]